MSPLPSLHHISHLLLRTYSIEFFLLPCISSSHFTYCFMLVPCSSPCYFAIHLFILPCCFTHVICLVFLLHALLLDATPYFFHFTFLLRNLLPFPPFCSFTTCCFPLYNLLFAMCQIVLTPLVFCLQVKEFGASSFLQLGMSSLFFI